MGDFSYLSLNSVRNVETVQTPVILDLMNGRGEGLSETGSNIKDMNMNAPEIKGYLFIQSVQSVENFHKKQRESFLEELFEPSPLNGRMTYAGNGWYKISHSIPDGEFIKIAAHRDNISVEARFNFTTPIPNRWRVALKEFSNEKLLVSFQEPNKQNGNSPT